MKGGTVTTGNGVLTTSCRSSDARTCAKCRYNYREDDNSKTAHTVAPLWTRGKTSASGQRRPCWKSCDKRYGNDNETMSAPCPFNLIMRMAIPNPLRINLFYMLGVPYLHMYNTLVGRNGSLWHARAAARRRPAQR